jgi:hypothetical protein
MLSPSDGGSVDVGSGGNEVRIWMRVDSRYVPYAESVIDYVRKWKFHHELS